MRASAIQGVLGLISLPLVIFGIGWVGTERIWYLRLFGGKTLNRSEAWTFTWKFFARYLRLGLLFALIYGPVMIYVFVVAFQKALKDPQTLGRPEALATRVGAPFLLASLLTVVLDFVLTFVTPALAFTTAKVSQALGVGLRTIVAQWSRSLLYVVVPPLAIFMAARLSPAGFVNPWLRAALIPLTSVFNLWFKGATAAFYLRRHPGVGDDGAVYLTAASTPPDSATAYDWSRVR
jgi:hypothetical protein